MHSNPTERRRSERLPLQIPIFLRGLDSAGTAFLELTKTLNISATGALLLSCHPLQPDQLLRITIPVTTNQVSGLVPQETPPIQLRVVNSTQTGDTHLIRAEFVTRLAKPIDSVTM